MVMQYAALGRRLHNKTQEDINAMAQKAWLELSGAPGPAEGQGHPGFQPAGDMAIVNTADIQRQEIIQTPDGRPMAIANSMSRILHRAESGGANDWEVVTVPGGRSFLRSPGKGHQEWLDNVVTGEHTAWPSPPPESKEHEAARLAEENAKAQMEADKAAMVLANAAAEATKATALANDAAEATKATALANAAAEATKATALANAAAEVTKAAALANAAAEATKATALAKGAAEAANAQALVDMQADAQAMQARYQQMERELAHFRQAQATTTADAEAKARAKAWDDKMKLVVAKEAADDAKAALDKQAIEAEAMAKAKAWDDKMKLAVAKEAADDAKAALDKQAIEAEAMAKNVLELQATERQKQLAAKEQADVAAKEQADVAAKEQADLAVAAKQADAAAKERAMSKEQADMAAKEQAEMAAKDQKGVNLLGMMAQQVKRSVMFAHA